MYSIRLLSFTDLMSFLRVVVSPQSIQYCINIMLLLQDVDFQVTLVYTMEWILHAILLQVVGSTEIFFRLKRILEILSSGYGSHRNLLQVMDPIDYGSYRLFFYRLEIPQKSSSGYGSYRLWIL